MTGDWRRLALAALAAAAVAVACVTHRRSAGARQDDGQEGASQGGRCRAGRRDGEAAAKKPAKKKKQDPAEAQRAIEAALKLLEAGKAGSGRAGADHRARGGNLPPAIMAKALLYRGIAYRQQKKPAQAIADLTSALWLKGGLRRGRSQRRPEAAVVRLSGSGTDRERRADRARRAERRARDAHGLRVRRAIAPPPEAAASRRQPIERRLGQPVRRLVRRLVVAARQPAAARSAGAGDHRIDRGTPQPAPASPRRRRRPSPAHGRATPRCAAAPQPRCGEPSPRPSPKAGSASRSGWCARRPRRRRSRPRSSASTRAALATREPEIDEAVVGNMGSFYRVRVGPFASAQEGQAACAKLKGTGIDCLVVAQ